MNTSDATQLQNALHSVPLPTGLEPDPLDVLQQAHSAQRRQRARTSMLASSGVLAITVAGFWIATDVAGTRPADDSQFAAEPTLTEVPANESVFDIGRGWQMSVDENDASLCLEPAPQADFDSGPSCIVEPQFASDSTLGFAGEDSGDPVYAWVIRDTTDSAELVSDSDETLLTPIYDIPALDLRIAITHDLPIPFSGWTLTSRNDEGEVTDTVPVKYEKPERPESSDG